MRAFVAVNLPPAERVLLHEALNPLRSCGLAVRWIAPESLHLTLQFLGRVDDDRVAPLRTVIARVAGRGEPFELRLGELGAFPRLDRPRVWWVGVEPEPRLMAVQRALEAALAELGHAPEERPFSPHVTIGRATGERSSAGPLVADVVAAFAFRARFDVHGIDLMESHLSPRGARYSRVCAAPLGGDGVLSTKAAEAS